MMLSDGDLQEIIEAGCLSVVPDGIMQPASIDLHLGGDFLTFPYMTKGEFIYPEHPPTPRSFSAWDEKWLPLDPGEFILVSTIQTISLCDEYAARVEGKSSLGRLGLMVHSTAGFIDPGFQGQITLELSNVNSTTIMLTPGMAIAQLCIFQLKTPARKPYGHPDLGSRYQGQQGPTASRPYA